MIVIIIVIFLMLNLNVATSLLLDVLAYTDNAISRDISICNGRSVLIDCVFHVYIFMKLVRILKRILDCSSATDMSCKLWYLLS
jgi:hypothetical protein